MEVTGKRLALKSLAVALVAGSAVFSGLAMAQADYPNRPITFMVPYAAGGPTDVIARKLALGLTQELGQTVVVENRTGAGGLITLGLLARAQPDGYTLAFVASPVTAISPLTQPNFPYDTVTAFTPITDVVDYSLVLMAGKHVPAKNVAELVDYARKNPKAVSYGSSGIGGTNHLAGELFSRAAAAPMLHVPYKGNAPAVNDAMAGQISFVFDQPNTAQAMARSGKLTPLAITSAKRNPMLPDVPTMIESGYPDMVVEGWQGLIGPGKLPPQVVKKLEDAIRKVKASRVFADSVESGGFIMTPTSSAAFGERMRKERDFWKNVITSGNIKLQ
ncbi:Bug family tripartite tricarboxylate transporter substrate binding protein [Lacisediminimonas profundi]|uniref:Bug family tripartite tricarboxylate transporter substrate binding protein n=1 Tax=Lacisediminimonas profundi TaxID=2603856 RepID=UPI0013868401|nr:tripartite tricarboxylate transporter substrate binding protein [Lacisediminimonas profundi]